MILILLLAIPAALASWSEGKVHAIDGRDIVTTANEVLLMTGTEQAKATQGKVEIQAQQIIAREYISTDGLLIGDEVNTHGSNKTMYNRTWNDARVDGLANRDKYRLDVSGTGHIQLLGPKAKVGTHEQKTETEVVTFTRVGETHSWNVSHLHRTSGTISVLAITGDFVISFWEWDAEISNSTESRTHWTGLRRANETVENTVTNEYQDRRLYLHVTNGTLRLPTLWLDVTRSYANVTHVDASRASVSSIDGTVTNLSGPVHLHIGTHDGGSFMSRIVQEAAPEADSSIVQKKANAEPATTEVSNAGPNSGLWTLYGLGFVILVLASAVLIRTIKIALIRRAMSSGDYKRVAATAGFVSSRRFGPEFVVAKTVSLVKTQDYSGASKILERYGSRLAPAVLSYLWACIHAGRGDKEAARTEAIKSILADPAMASEVGANRELRGFMSELRGEGYS